MADDSNDKNKVGYRNSPVEHQFPKGISGNPSGRPRRARFEKSMAKMLDEILAEGMSVTIKRKKKRILPEEYTLRKQVQQIVSSGSFYDLEALKEYCRRKG